MSPESNSSPTHRTEFEPIPPKSAGVIHLDDVPPGTTIVVETAHRVYTIVTRDNGETWISGHPIMCPEPTIVKIWGSSAHTGMLWKRYICRGMHLELSYSDSQAIKTSRILAVREESGNPRAEL